MQNSHLSNHETLDGRKWREGGDLNPRVLADTGLAIQRLAELGYLRLGHNMLK